MSLARVLRAHSVLVGRGAQRGLVQLCHAGRLVGGLSVSLRATPDEVVGPLCATMGGGAASVRVLDVSTSTPMKLEVAFDAPPDPLRDAGERRTEAWEVEDVAGLVHNLNDLYRDDARAKIVIVLGEWEDMLQLWALEKRVARELRDVGALEGRNMGAVSSILDGR